MNRIVSFISLSVLTNLAAWSALAAYLGAPPPDPPARAARDLPPADVALVPPPPTPAPEIVPPSLPPPPPVANPARPARPRLRSLAPAPPAAVATVTPVTPEPVRTLDPEPTALVRPGPVVTPLAARPLAVAPTPPPPPAVAGISAGERAALQRRIRSAIHGKRRYPRLARIRGIEGQVVIEFRIRPGGSVAQARVVRSAGAILDQAALAALREAAPLPYYPDRVTVPIVFTLED